MKVLLILLISMSLIVNAEVVKSEVNSEVFNFSYSGFEGRNRVFVSCDYAEYQLEKFLTQIGAKELSIFCSGGIAQGQIGPVHLNATYSFKDIDMSGEKIEIKSDYNSNCYFDTKLLKQLFRKYEYSIEVTSSRSACFDRNSRYYFNFIFNE